MSATPTPAAALSPSWQDLVAAGQAIIQDWKKIPLPERPLSDDALDVLYGLGVNALQAGQFTDAQAAFALLLNHLPANPNYLAGMGHALRGHDQLAEATMMFALAMESAELHNKTQHALALAQVLIDAHEPEVAMVLLDLPSSGSEPLEPWRKQLKARAEAVHALKERAESAVH